MGCARVGELAAHKARYLAGRLEELPGVRLVHRGGFVREFALTLPTDADEAVAAMAERGFLAGIPLGVDYPELKDGLLVAVTERRTPGSTRFVRGCHEGGDRRWLMWVPAVLPRRR